MKYSLEMQAKVFDLSSNIMVCVLHEDDARELGLRALDRIEITNHLPAKKAVAVLDTTKREVVKGEIGLFEELSRVLRVKKTARLTVKPVQKLESVSYICKKIRNGKLSQDEIEKIVEDLNTNRLSEIELSALMTAVFIRGWSLDESVAMTKALIRNGKTLDLGKKVVLDKHCIGGINGRTTMLVVPIVAAAGQCIPKTSSRSITSASGTADAMEVLAKVDVGMKKMLSVVNKTGGCIVWGGSLDLAPVDDKIIRVEHPLSLDPPGQIIASVMAKKAAVGTRFLVIDLPVGPDVKIKGMDEADQLAGNFIKVGKELGITVEVLITDGSEPCGKTFGPALEARTVMEILEGKYFDNLAKKACETAGALLEMAGDCKRGKGFARARGILESGKALEKMRQIIREQGGKAKCSGDIRLSEMKKKFHAPETGEISKLNVRVLARIAREAGAPKDKNAGVLLHVEEGQVVKKGDVLFEVFAENALKLEAAMSGARKENPVEFEKTVIQKVGFNGKTGKE